MKNPLLCAALFLSPAAASAQPVAFDQGISVSGLLGTAREASADMPAFEAVPVGMDADVAIPKDFTARRIKGVLTLAPAAVVELATPEGGRMALQNGPVSLKYGKPSFGAYFNRERSVALTQGSRSAAFPARSPDYRSFGDFKTSSSPEQPALLKGTQTKAIVKQWTREARHSCTYSGFCYNTSIGSDNQFHSSYSFSNSCSGSQKVLEGVKLIQTDVTVRILSREGGALLGTIIAEPRQDEVSETLEYLTSCS